MRAHNEWVILERFSGQDSVPIEKPDEARFMEASASMYTVVSVGKVFGPDGWEDLPYKEGEHVLASTIGGIRIRTKSGKTLFAVRYNFVICTLEEGDL